MTDKESQYKSMTTRTIRGLEARSRVKWEKDGWEFVSQSQLSRIRSELIFRRVKKKMPWFLWPSIAGGVLLLVGMFVLLAVLQPSGGSGNTAQATPDATSAPLVTSTPSSPTVVKPSPEASAIQTLDEINAAQYLALQWEAKFTYGGEVRWIGDRITTVNPDGTYTFKILATFTNQYGTDVEATIEGDVAGTNGAPVITDSILYTDDGQIVDFYG